MNKNTQLLGSGVMEIQPISNFPMFRPDEPSDDSFSGAELDLDDEALGMLADLAIDEEIEDNVEINDLQRGIATNRNE